MRKILSAIALMSISGLAMAANLSPVGTWKTIDDVTGKPRSVIRIVEKKGEIKGFVKKILKIGDEEPKKTCEKCEGERKNKPIVGMNIIWGVEKEDEGEYGGGHILDPKNGKEYRVNMTLIDGGTKMKVRGYVGFSIFGRTQVWHRAS